MPKIAILVLAAGSASRMGKIKQLLPFGKSTLLGTVINNALETSNKVYVVLGANVNEIENELEVELEKVTVIHNENWSEGLSSSIKKGISYLQKKEKELDGILVCLGDQPFVNSNYLNKMIHVFVQDQNKIIASDYKGKNGVPAIFPKAYFDNLSNLKKDQGAKQLLKNNTDVITLTHDFIFEDVDTYEDYLNFK